MLDPFSRGTLVAVAVLCVSATIALAPIRARSALPLPQPVSGVPGVGLGATAVPPLAIRRDPFAEPAPPTLPAQAAPTISSTVPRSDTDSNGTLAPLPPNLANATIPDIPGTPAADTGAATTRVSAVVTGAHPYALIATGGMHAIRGLGDRVGTNTIVGIDLTGVRLSDGARLAVDRDGTP